MIQTYRKFSVELVLRSEHAAPLVDFIRSLVPKYRPVLFSDATALISEQAAIEARAQAFGLFFEKALGFPKPSPTIEIVVPHENSDCIALLEFALPAHFNTEFTRANRTAGAFTVVLHLWSASEVNRAAEDQLLATIRSLLKESLRLPAEPPLTLLSTTHPVFPELKQKAAAGLLTLGPAEIDASKSLQNRDLLNVVLRTKQAREPSLQNITNSSGLEQSRVEQLLRDAANAGLVARKFDVICHKCSTVLSRVGDLHALRRFAVDDVTCHACGSPVKDDSFREVYSATDRAGKLLDNSTWMSLLMRHYLEKMGVPPYDIAIEALHGPNEIAVALNCDGELLLMELKDSRFTMDHAYSFVGKCSRYKPNHTLIVATDGIDADVKDYIANTGAKPIYLQSLESAVQEIRPLLHSVYSDRLEKAIARVAWADNFTRTITLRLEPTRHPLSPAEEAAFTQVQAAEARPIDPQFATPQPIQFNEPTRQNASTRETEPGKTHPDTERFPKDIDIAPRQRNEQPGQGEIKPAKQNRQTANPKPALLEPEGQ